MTDARPMVFRHLALHAGRSQARGKDPIRVNVESLIKQFFDSVRHVIGEVLRAGLIGLVVGIALVELAGVFIEGHWPFHPFVHVLAVVFGLVLGYALAMTVAFFEGVKSIFSAVGQVENDIESALRGAVEGSAQRVGEVVDAVEHHPQRRAAQQPVTVVPAAPQYVDAAQYPPQAPSAYPQYGQPGQYGPNPQYPQYSQGAPDPQYPTYPPRQ